MGGFQNGFGQPISSGSPPPPVNPPMGAINNPSTATTANTGTTATTATQAQPSAPVQITQPPNPNLNNNGQVGSTQSQFAPGPGQVVPDILEMGKQMGEQAFASFLNFFCGIPELAISQTQRFMSTFPFQSPF